MHNLGVPRHSKRSLSRWQVAGPDGQAALQCEMDLSTMLDLSKGHRSKGKVLTIKTMYMHNVEASKCWQAP